MPGKCSQTCHGSGFCAQLPICAELQNHKNRQPALERIQQQRQQRRFFIAAAQHIGCARVAAAVAARIVQAHDAADDDGKVQRTQNVGDSRNKQQGRGLRHGE